MWRKSANGTALNDFRDCISESQLMEIPNTGFLYTWWNKQVGRFKIMGKLDRMLCNAEWCSKFQGWNYKVGSRICSDHSPIMGCGINVPSPGNMPFKFFNRWCTDPNFKDIVKASWEIPIWGHSIFILTQKLKRLKATPKKWNKEVFGNITSKVEKESKNLERMQNQFEMETVTEEFIEMMVEQEKKVELLLQQE
ncbi:hypothetical protein IFM89_006825 [Coptis chinensis]|uniref:Uncharacterized protein n=1 Tax=Coptis chinensis TaxID=261450 RepID=A0A835LZH6_9MAGN|nr:hypothetical protein IFM89_006825 [Coptis chinensis]